MYSLNGEIHNCWIFLDKKCIFCESLKPVKKLSDNPKYILITFTRLTFM